MPRVSKKNKYFDKSEVITEFYENFSKNVMPLLNTCEVERKKDLACFLTIYAVVIFVVYFICSNYFEWYTQPGFNSIVIGVIILVFTYFWLVQGFAQELKKICMPALIKCFGSMKWNTKKSKVPNYDFQVSELFSVFNGRIDDDSFVGVYKGVEYKVQETYLYSVQGGSKKLFWPVFDGVVITFDCNKEIKNKTIVTFKGDINVRNTNPIVFGFIVLYVICCLPLFVMYISNGDFIPLFDFSIFIFIVFVVGLLVYRFCGLKGSEKLTRIRLEDPVFDRKYNAYSSDEIEGRYLLTTAFMERFKNLHTAFGSYRAKCSFYDNKIMFSISTVRNLFEVGNLFLPVNNVRASNKFLAEISAIFDLIDYFKLDEKTGL